MNTSWHPTGGRAQEHGTFDLDGKEKSNESSADIHSLSEEEASDAVKLSIVIPCYNEFDTLKHCVKRVLSIADQRLRLEIIIVDDGSTDGSINVAKSLVHEYEGVVKVFVHERNRGKGAALRTGFIHATGDFVAVQDADLEYDPRDLRRLLGPLVNGHADVVIGSRFLSGGAHRVLYFWHSMGNRFLTMLSNMFTDLNLTDMESCYKIFRREIIQKVDVQENRFGFEPEIVAKMAHMRVRVYEMGISYHGRTYEEGKKIGVKDGLRAIYCIFHYNAHRAPLPIQFLIYLFIGGSSALFNLGTFMSLHRFGIQVEIAAPAAFLAAAAMNYLLCILILFRHQARWQRMGEVGIYMAVVLLMAGVDLLITRTMILADVSVPGSKIIATSIGLILNFLLRRFLVFQEPASGPWSVSKADRETEG